MKVLYLCTDAPQTIESNANIFLKRRLDVLVKYVQLEIFSLLPDESVFLGLLRKLLRKTQINKPENNVLKFENFTWNNLSFKQNVFTKVLRKINPSRLVEISIKKAEERIDLKSFDLIHVHYGFPFGAVALHFKQKFGIPYVMTLHGSDIHTDPFKNKIIKRHLVEGLENAETCIFVSKKLLEISKTLGYSGKNAVVISNGVDTQVFSLMNKEKIKSELGLTKKVIGFVGSLIPVKRADKFPEIFKNIHLQNPETEFLVVGEGALRRTIENELIAAKIPVRFAGSVEPKEVPYYMNAMDVVILPSRNEGWPCIVLEAQSCGIPVVGSNNGGIPEAIGDENLIVAEGENFEKRFADKVCQVLNMKINQNSLIKRASEFSWENLVKKEMQIYENILQKKLLGNQVN